MADDIIDLEALDSGEDNVLSSETDEDEIVAPVVVNTGFVMTGLGQTARDARVGAGQFNDPVPASESRPMPDLVHAVLVPGQRAAVFADLTGGKKMDVSAAKVKADAAALEAQAKDAENKYISMVTKPLSIDPKNSRDREIWAARVRQAQMKATELKLKSDRAKARAKTSEARETKLGSSKRGRREREERVNKRRAASEAAGKATNWRSSSDDESDEDEPDFNLVPDYIGLSDFANLYANLGPVMFGPKSARADIKLSSSDRALVMKETAQCLYGPRGARRDVRKRVISKPRDELTAELSSSIITETTPLVTQAGEEGQIPKKSSPDAYTFGVHEPAVYCALLSGACNSALLKHMPNYFVDFRFSRDEVTVPFASPWTNPTAAYNAQVYFKGSVTAPLLESHLTLSLFSVAVNSCSGKVVLSDQEVGMVSGVFMKLSKDAMSSAKVCLSMASVLARGLTGFPACVAEKVLYYLYKLQVPNSKGVKAEGTGHYTFILGSVFLFGGIIPRGTWWFGDDFFHKCLATRLRWPLFGRTPYHINLLECKAGEVNLFALRKDVFLCAAGAMASYIEGKHPGAVLLTPLHSTVPAPTNPNSIYVPSAMPSHVQRLTVECYLPARHPVTKDKFACRVSEFVKRCATFQPAVKASETKPGNGMHESELARIGMIWLATRFSQMITAASDASPAVRATIPGFEKLIFQDYDYVCNSVETPGFQDLRYRVTPSLCELSFNMHFLLRRRVFDKMPTSTFLDPLCLAGRVAQDVAVREVEPATFTRNRQVWARQYSQLRQLKSKWVARRPELAALTVWAPYINDTSPLMMDLPSVDGPPVEPAEFRTRSAKMVNTVRGYMTMASIIDDIMFRSKSGKKSKRGQGLPNTLPVPGVSNVPLREQVPVPASASAKSVTAFAYLKPATVSAASSGVVAVQEENGISKEAAVGPLAFEDVESNLEKRVLVVLKRNLRSTGTAAERDALLEKEALRAELAGDKDLARGIRRHTKAHKRKTLINLGLESVRASGPLSKLDTSVALLQRVEENIKNLMMRRRTMMGAGNPYENATGVVVPAEMAAEAADLADKDIEEALADQRAALRSGLADNVRASARSLMMGSEDGEVKPETSIIRSTMLTKEVFERELKLLMEDPSKTDTLIDTAVRNALSTATTESEKAAAKTWEMTMTSIRTAAMNLRDDDGTSVAVDLDFTDEDDLPDEMREARIRIRAERRELRQLIKNRATEEEVTVKALEYDYVGPIFNSLTPEEQATLALAINRISSEHDEVAHLLETAGYQPYETMYMGEGLGAERIPLVDQPTEGDLEEEEEEYGDDEDELEDAPGAVRKVSKAMSVPPPYNPLAAATVRKRRAKMIIEDEDEVVRAISSMKTIDKVLVLSDADEDELIVEATLEQHTLSSGGSSSSASSEEDE